MRYAPEENLSSACVPDELSIESATALAPAVWKLDCAAQSCQSVRMGGLRTNSTGQLLHDSMSNRRDRIATAYRGDGSSSSSSSGASPRSCSDA